jgi:type I restriction enzyme R subunit
VILSNGNSHYFWDLERGNPQVISKFPPPDSITGYAKFKPNPERLVQEAVGEDYIALTQKPDYQADPSWNDATKKQHFILNNKLRFLRPYQIQAVQAVQKAVSEGSDRFLLGMATGTGKTLVSAALIKLFLRTSNARRVLFLVDRLELEDQASRRFKEFLKNDYKTVVYKENRNDWRSAEIVVSTIQTFLSNNRYKRLFAPDDFDLVISDEAHRSISGNSRAVFEYCMGYKLGLTATPRDYLKGIDSKKLSEKDPRELERRILLDTYRTFGCENGTPTFSYSLVDGVKDGYLVNPVVVDARTEVTTQLLSDEGYAVVLVDEKGNPLEEIFEHKDFEHKFFSEDTNRVFCEAFLRNALRDPISGEIGKSIVFCVSQNHAAKIAQILNVMAHQLFPGKYQSDFAMQVTSSVTGAQQFTINFSNNNLSGSGNFSSHYKTSKTRLCVTVGMMTTGYDCEDLLNLCLMRPIFSPTDFIQIKGRGTRTYDFLKDIIGAQLKQEIGSQKKEHFKLFDFFANCVYFEEEFNYDEVIKLPPITSPVSISPVEIQPIGEYENPDPDKIASFRVSEVGPDGMKIDRMYFDKFQNRLKEDKLVLEKIQSGEWEAAIQQVEEKYFDKPEEFYNLEKLGKSVNADRRLTLREILELIFGLIPYIKSKDELLDEAFDKFDSRYMPPEKEFYNAKNFFKTYLVDPDFRSQVEAGNFASLIASHTSGEFLNNLSTELRKKIIGYIKDYVPLNQFA